MYDLLRSLFFHLDPELAHDLAIRYLAFSQSAPPRTPGPLARRVLGIDFPSPVGLAAGFDKGACVWPGLARLGFGFVEIGTVTPRPQPGNPRPRIFRIPHERALVNRLGFNNDGAQIVADRLARLGPSPIPIGINVGKNRDTPAARAAEDYAAAARLLAPHAAYVAVNVSSPNTPGLRDLAAAAPLTEIVQAVRASASGRPVLVKLSPDLDDRGIDEACRAALDAGAAGLIACNTTVARPISASETGGLSGAPLRPLALATFKKVAARVAGRAVLIGCGGIETAADAKAYFDAGASLVQIYTGFIYGGPATARRIESGLSGP